MENEKKFTDEDPTLVDAQAIELEETDVNGTEEAQILDTTKYALANLDAAIEEQLEKMAKKNKNLDREKMKQEIYYKIMETLSGRAGNKK